jgi:xylulokinase
MTAPATRCTLGVDIGTFESKGVLVDAAGEIVASAARPHRLIAPRPGWAEHDAEACWWGDFVALTRELLGASRLDPAQVQAAAVSGIGPCMLPVDAGGRALSNAVLYGVDTRATAEIAELTAALGEARLIERNGNLLTSQAVGPKILWHRRNRPELWARTAAVHNASGFLVERLTGRRVIDHYSASGFTPLYDIRVRDWDREAAELICPLSVLPELMWSTEIAGGVTAEAAEATGLARGTPVTAGAIDAGAEAVSVGVMSPGEMMVMYGSTMFLILVTERPQPGAATWYAPFVFPDQHISMGGAATSGTLTHWFRERFAQELDPATALGALADEAAGSPPGARGLIALPYFSGERTPIQDPTARGAIFGLDLTHSRADVYRAILEGIAYGVGHIVEAFEGAGQRPSRVAAVGGGVRNAVWAQSVSDVTGLAQQVHARATGAAYGDAFLAAVAVGAATREDIRRWNPAARTIAPDPAGAAALAKGYPLFKRLYLQTRDLMAELAALGGG